MSKLVSEPLRLDMALEPDMVLAIDASQGRCAVPGAGMRKPGEPPVVVHVLAAIDAGDMTDTQKFARYVQIGRH